MWHEFQALAARGYVVFWSNPRGSTGYGESFMQAIERDWGEVTLADVMAGVETVAERPYVDESNAFVTGGSFGGFMTAWTVGQTDYFRAAGVTLLYRVCTFWFVVLVAGTISAYRQATPCEITRHVERNT
jgi:dipeptidyl aminopeptidase/acylaminoacyl peptidase